VTEIERVDIAASYARRLDDEVQLVLLLPDAEPGPGPVVVRLRDGGRTLKHPATIGLVPGGARLEMVAPAQKLGRGVWRLAVRTRPDAAFTRIEARLLTGRGQPVALLPGPAPETRMPAPEPAGRPATEAARGLPARMVRRARRVIGGGRLG
jgi:hypothetical protein